MPLWVDISSGTSASAGEGVFQHGGVLAVKQPGTGHWLPQHPPARQWQPNWSGAPSSSAVTGVPVQVPPWFTYMVPPLACAVPDDVAFYLRALPGKIHADIHLDNVALLLHVGRHGDVRSLARQSHLDIHGCGGVIVSLFLLGSLPWQLKQPCRRRWLWCRRWLCRM